MQTLTEAGWMGWVQVGLLAGGLVWALVCVVLLGLKVKVPPVIAVAPLLAHAVVVAAGGSWFSRLVSGAHGLAPDQRSSWIATGVSGMLSHGVLAAAAIPTAFLLLLGGVFAGARGRRKWGAAVLVFVVGGGVALVPLGSLLSHGELALAAGRFVVYGLAVLPLAASMIGAHPNDNSREGGIVAAAAFATLVGACEIVVFSSSWERVFSAIAMADTASRVKLLEAGAAEIAALQTYTWVALVLASIPGFVALFRPPAELTDEEIMSSVTSPSAVRWFGGALALAVPVAWAIALLCVDPAGIMAMIVAK